MLSSYRRATAEPGTLRFSAAGLVARLLPISMVGLGIVLLVSSATGSYGLAGAVSAAYMVTNARLDPPGRLVDRSASRWCSVTASAGLRAVHGGARDRGPVRLADPRRLPRRRGGRGSLPQIGSCVRARWSYVLRDPADIQTAYAIEAVVDEAVFMLGRSS